MHSLAGSNLVGLLKTLSSEETDRFDKFVQSPYHNSIANLRKLLPEIRKHAPEYAGERFSREEVWKGIFPGKKFNYGILKNLIHELTVLLQKFLVAEAVESNANLKERLLIEQLIIRDAGSLSEKKQREHWKKFNTGKDPDSKYAIQESYLDASNIFWLKTSYDKIRKLKIPGASEYYLGAAYSTISYFSIICNEYNNAVADSAASEIILDKQIPVMIAKALNSGPMDEILAELRKHSDKDHRVLDTLVALNKAQIHEGNAELFNEFRSKLTENAELFSKKDLKDIYNNLTSVQLLLDGYEVNVGEEMLKNFDLMLRFGILADDNGRMNSMYYYYYMICAFRNLKFERVAEFADRFLTVTDGDDSGNLDNLTSALIAFGKGEFDLALSGISKMKQAARYIDFFIREFRACCFYELNAEVYFEREHQALLSLRKDYELHFPKLTGDLKFHFQAIRKLFDLRKEFDVVLYRSVTGKLKKSRVWISRKLTEIEKDQNTGR